MDERRMLDFTNEAHAFFGQAADHFDKAGKRAELEDRRHAELVRVHQQGWSLVANAIGKGLADIANAIRGR